MQKKRASVGHNTTPEYWAEQINARWQDSVESIIDCGRLLNKARAACSHGQWGEVLKMLRFGEDTARALRRIAKNEIITKPEFIKVLPPSWGTLRHLTYVEDEVLEKMLRESLTSRRGVVGSVHPDMTQREALWLKDEANKRKLEAQGYEPGGPLAERFGVPPVSVLELSHLVAPAAHTFELAYRWFCPPAGLVLDPFPADGSVRGEVAARLGREYVGVDLSDKRQREALSQEPPRFDFILTCPPFWTLDPARLSRMSRDDFLRDYGEVIAAAVGSLRDDRFACCVVDSARDADGFLVNLPQRTTELFARAGAKSYNECILTFRSYETFRTLLVFVKGSWRRAVKLLDSEPIGDLSRDRPHLEIP